MSVNINADTTNGLVLTSDTSGEIKLQSAGTEIASVTANGIDVTGELDVDGKLVFSVGSTRGIAQDRNGTISNILWKDTTTTDNLNLFNPNGSNLIFGTNNTERMRIKSDGLVAINNPTLAPGTDTKLQVASGHIHLTGNSTKVKFGPTNFTGSAGPYGLEFYDDTDGVISWYFRTGSNEISVEDDAVAKLKISGTTGNVTNSNNSYGGFSDIKLKQDIVDASSQWEDIKNVQVRKYKLKQDVIDNGDDAITHIGVIAQELETAGLNGLVETKDDFDENDQPLDTQTKYVKYSVLYMKALKALQEAITKIEDLETRIEALENA